MDEDQVSESLAIQKADYVASAAKAVLGVVPFAGSLLAEVAGTVIPNQRMDRIVNFAEMLEQRLSGLEQDFVRSQLNNEHFTDLLEEGLRQAARSLSDERREYIANLIANSLSSEDIEFIEAKHLLRVLGEINDIEVIWLKYHFNAQYHGIGDQDPLWEKHEAVLQPVGAAMGDPQNIHDKETFQESYQNHLVQLNLLYHQFRIDRATGLPEVDRFNRNFEVAGYKIAPLGSLLVRQIRIGEDDPSG